MRHGATERPGRLWGHGDEPSSAEGVALCVERARGLDFARVVTSDLSRARVPGALIASERAVRHEIDRRWRELDFGHWDGADPAHLPEQDLARFWSDPQGFPPPEGERWSDLHGRVAAALDDVHEPALVVTHAGAIRAALAALCGLDLRQGWAVDLSYGAVLTLRLWPGKTPSAQMTGLLT
nr:histidine phosphatase family protein [Sphingobium sp. Sx8-8]